VEIQGTSNPCYIYSLLSGTEHLNSNRKPSTVLSTSSPYFMEGTGISLEYIITRKYLMPPFTAGVIDTAMSSSSEEPPDPGRKYTQIAANHPVAEQYHNLLPQLLPYLCRFQESIIILAPVGLPSFPREASIPTVIIGLSVPRNHLCGTNIRFRDLYGPLHVEILHILEKTPPPPQRQNIH